MEIDEENSSKTGERFSAKENDSSRANSGESGGDHKEVANEKARNETVERPHVPPVNGDDHSNDDDGDNNDHEQDDSEVEVEPEIRRSVYLQTAAVKATLAETTTWDRNNNSNNDLETESQRADETFDEFATQRPLIRKRTQRMKKNRLQPEKRISFTYVESEESQVSSESERVRPDY